MTLKVGYLLKKFPRLSETFVLNEILAQEALGRSLHVFSRRPPDDEPRHVQLGRLKAEVEVLPPAQTLDLRLLFASPEAERIDHNQLAALVREALTFEHPRRRKLLSEALHLGLRAAEAGVDHLHVHFATESAIVAMLLRGMGGPTYSLTAHAKDIYRSTVDPRLLSRIVALSSFTVTVCDANVDYLRDMLTPEASQQVRRLYNGIDLEAFAPRETSPVNTEILGVGRLVPKKGFDVLLRAVALLHRERLPCHLTLVGEGDERESLQDLADVLEISDRVTFTGPLPQHEMLPLLDRATVFCLPCRIDTDGNRDALPTVLLEALAVGVPVVSTRVTGIPEILDDGRVGALVDSDDPAAVADGLRRVLEDPSRQARAVARGLEHVRQNFDGRAAARTLGAWLDEVEQEVTVR